MKNQDFYIIGKVEKNVQSTGSYDSIVAHNVANDLSPLESLVYVQ